MLTFPRDIAHKALTDAITLHRRARISLSTITSQGDTDAIRIAVARVISAAKAERSARRAFAPFKREDRIAAKAKAVRRQRYHYQHSRKSRTSDQARDLRTSRAERRHAAALATERKRAVNQINAPFMVSTDA